MDRDFRKGHIEIDFPTEPFDSIFRLLLRSIGIFFSNLRFLATITLVIYLPAKLSLQFACYLFDVPTDGILSYLLIDFSDLLLSALVIPAAVYGLVTKFRTGRTAPLRECLRWGRRQWGKLLWNQFKVEITIALWGALLIVPGVIAMVKLTFVDAIVSIEADREVDALERSRRLTEGRRWRIFFVLLPLLIFDLAGSYLVLSAWSGSAHSRVAIALADSLLSVGGQWTTVTVLLMYLGAVRKAGAPASGPPVRSGKSRGN